MDQATLAQLTIIGTEVGAGTITGFFLGYGLKKILSFLFKALAILVAAFTVPLLGLAYLGIVKLDFARLASVIESVFSKLIDFTLYAAPLLVKYLPISGGLGLGMLLGGLKK
jgi:uncharacterized membrane protein (Fun14 family)